MAPKNSDNVKVVVTGLVDAEKDLKFSQTPVNPYFYYLFENGKLILNLNSKKVSLWSQSKIKATLAGDNTTSATLNVYFKDGNILLGNIKAYAPVPGDGILPSTDGGFPVPGQVIELNGRTYTYIIDQDEKGKKIWYMIVNNDVEKKYFYSVAKNMYELKD